MNPQIETFGDFIILKNEDLLNTGSSFSKKWNEEIKKINPLFQLNALYPLNRTILFNYGKSTPLPIILSLDICINICTLIVPYFQYKCTIFVEQVLPSIVSYLTNHIKTISNVTVANEINYKFYIYIHQNHPQFQTLYNNPLITFQQNYFKKSILQRDLGDNYTQGLVYLYFNENWDIIQKISKNTSSNMMSS